MKRHSVKLYNSISQKIVCYIAVFFNALGRSAFLKGGSNVRVKIKIINFALMLFGIGLFTAFTTVQAQNLQQRDILQSLSKVYEHNFATEKAKAIQFADSLGIPTKLETEGGVAELMRFENGIPRYYTTFNAEGADLINSDKVYPGANAGLNLSGAGQTLGIWDGGGVLTTHQEFGGRITQIDLPSTIHYHPTHVAGTMVAAGEIPLAKGMSYAANLDAYDWDFDASEMVAAAAAGLKVSQHSYGSIAGWYFYNGYWYWYGDVTLSTEEDYFFGFYTSATRLWDEIAHSAPNYLIVKSAGNDRGQGPEPGSFHYYWNGSSWISSNAVRQKDGGEDGYDCIPEKGNAKNILTVGAITGSSVMSNFSSWGPTDDGRIKPDIVAKGVSVYSTFDANNFDYASISGTSMSGPMVSGSVGLLLEHQENLNPGDVLLSSTVKGLIIHSANDNISGAPGPDYRFGWGIMNTEKAISIMSQDHETENIHIHELTLDNENEINIQVKASGNESLRATIVWNDVPGNPPPLSLNPTTLMLVNDLDLRIHDQESSTFFPYLLDPANPASTATTGDNVRDNVEMVHISSPVPEGIYNISISHKGTLEGGSQQVSLIITGNVPLSSIPNPQAFTATLLNPSEIELAWTKNNDNNDVMVAWSPNGTFGVPEDGVVYTPGQNLPDGGTVLYRGSDNSYVHAGLDPGTTYFYKAFSYTDTDQYSTGMTANAGTQCTYSILLTDTWGNGWDGGIFGLRQNGELILTFGEEFEDGYFYGPIEVSLSPDSPTEIFVIEEDWDKREVGFTIYYPWGDVFFGFTDARGYEVGDVVIAFNSWCEMPCSIEESCNYFVQMDDSHGDGWQGASFGVRTNGELLYAFGSQFDDGSSLGPIELRLCHEDNYEIFVISEDEYEEEVSFKIIDRRGNIIYELPFNSSFNQGEVLFDFEVDCEQVCNLADQCSYSIELLDDYGDGWQGAVIGLWQEEYLVAVYGANFIDGHTSGPIDVAICPDKYTRLTVFTSDGFPEEVGFIFKDPFGNVLVEADFGEFPPSGTSLISFMSYCSMPDCAAPINLAVTDIIGSSATVNWEANGGTLWELSYGLVGNDPDMGAIVSDLENTTYILEDLMLNTEYDVYVRAICGGNSSLWLGPFTFLTPLCMPEEICDFTVMLIDDWGDGWDGTVLGLRQNNIIVATFGEGFDDGDSFGPVPVSLCYSLNTQIVVVELGAWTEEKGFTLFDPDGNQVFHHSPGQEFNQHTIFHTFTALCSIDGICGIPLSPQVHDIGLSSVLLSWQQGGEESQWQVEYGPAGFTPGSGIEQMDAFTSTLTIDNLDQGTDYTAFVRAVCGQDEFSNWAGPVDFTTASCAQPTNVELTNATATTASFSWTGSALAEAYQLEYGGQGFSPGTGTLTITTSTSIVISDLVTNTSYDLYIRTDCDEVQSDWVGPLNFTTTGIIYVNAASECPGDGTSWATAFCNLQDALEAVDAGGEIWVAGGVYKPTSDPSDRVATFSMKNGLLIFGGFPPTGNPDMAERDWETYKTVLSGDIDNNDNVDSDGITPTPDDIVGDNSNSVVTLDALDDAVRLDGLYITGGVATANAGFNIPTARGAGIYSNNSDFDLYNATLSGNHARAGAAILAANGLVTMENVKVIDNSALNEAGGIFLNTGASLSAQNSEFINNSNSLRGGAISITAGGNLSLQSCQIEGNSSTASARGAAVFISATEFTISNTVFDGNFGAGSNNGSGLYAELASQGIVSNSTFLNNTAGTSGGAAYVEQSTVHFENTHFEGNIAQMGVAVRTFGNNTVVSFIDCDFIGNQQSSGSFGGTLFLQQGTLAQPVENCTFINNDLIRYSAIHSQIPMEIINCTFTENSATAIGTIYHSSGDLTIIDSEFTNNSGSLGGAIEFAAGGMELTIENSTFANNHATNQGGAIRFIANNAKLNISNSSFIGNLSQTSGGAIFKTGINVEMLISGSQFIGNEAITQYGGGVYHFTQQEIAIYENCLFDGNLAGLDGGAINASNSIEFVSCTFINNHAERDGGALSLGSSTIVNSIISNNTSQRHGGGLHFRSISGVDVVVEETEVSNNISQAEGGGIYITNGVHLIQNTTIKDNTANTAGGLRATSNVEVLNTKIIGNSAVAGHGGGILFPSTSSIHSLRIVGSLIAGNVASGDGGGFYGNSTLPDINIINTTIAGNKADGVGGGMRNQKPNMNFVNGIVWGNSTGVFNQSSGSLNAQHSIIQGGTDPCLNCPDEDGNIDPLFEDPIDFAQAPTSNGNYSLDACSPAVDAGTPDPSDLGLPENDLAGNPRIVNEIIDLGAYEYNGFPCGGELLLGDANCDGDVNILDVVTIINYILGTNPEPFCYDQANVNGDEVIDILDVVNVINLILNAGKSNVVSQTADIYLGNDFITFSSDGTVTALHLELEYEGTGEIFLDLVPNGYHMSYQTTHGKINVIIMHLQNKPLPEGMIELIKIGGASQLKWSDVKGANVNARKVKVRMHRPVDMTFGMLIAPNPSDGIFNLHYSLKDESTVQWNVLDLKGRQMVVGEQETKSAGQHSTSIGHAGQLSWGVYTLQVFVKSLVTNEEKILNEKIIIMK